MYTKLKIRFISHCRLWANILGSHCVTVWEHNTVWEHCVTVLLCYLRISQGRPSVLRTVPPPPTVGQRPCCRAGQADCSNNLTDNSAQLWNVPVTGHVPADQTWTFRGIWPLGMSWRSRATWDPAAATPLQHNTDAILPVFIFSTGPQSPHLTYRGQNHWSLPLGSSTKWTLPWKEAREKCFDV